MKGAGSSPAGTAKKGYMEYTNEAARAARVEQRRILGEYYRDLATNYSEYEKRALEIGPTMAWPSKPQVPEFANA